MALSAGTRLGPYEIVSAIGAGGMGEVYRATDTRLDRTVAVKVLPEALAADPQLRERFDREARAVSALDHPNICALYDVGVHDGTAYIVMQYLEGETLAARLEQAPAARAKREDAEREGAGVGSPRPLKNAGLPLDEALSIAMQIADALDKAHRAGVVHRDLKPANVMLTKSSAGSTRAPQAKLLDFGLAKTGASRVVASGLESGATALATTPPAITAQGMILGTFQYMAPEQIEGEEADARTDIFAFGMVLYEMVTGRKAFEGKTHASLLGAILKDDPPSISTRSQVKSGSSASMTAARKEAGAISIDAPMLPALDRVVRRCLAKAPDDRWQTASDLLEALRWVSEEQWPDATAPPAGRSFTRERVIWAAALLAIVALGAWSVFRPRTAPARRIVRFTVALPAGDQVAISGIAISPDGSTVVYGAFRKGAVMLYRRTLDQVEPVAIRGTELAEYPFFSPDGKWVGFFAGGALKKVPIDGGSPTTLCQTVYRYGATWASNGTIIFASQSQPDLMQVSDAGGVPQPVVRASQFGGAQLHFPSLLPEARAVVFQVGTVDAARIAVFALDTGKTDVVAQGTTPTYVDPGYLLFTRNGSLWGVKLDVKRLKTVGTPVPLLEGLQVNPGAGLAHYSVAPDGSLVWLSGTGAERRQLVWLKRDGTVQTVIDEPRVYGNTYADISLSPDETMIAAAIDNGSESDIWLYDLARHVLSRVTFSKALVHQPVWTPDNQRLVYAAKTGEGRMNLFWTRADGMGSPEQLSRSERDERPESVSPDGKFLVYSQTTPNAANDLWLLPLAGERKPQVFLATPFNEFGATFSPDGRWIAYNSDESGTLQAYVRALSGPGGKWQVSTTRGTGVTWRPDGTELQYSTGTAGGSRLAVSVEARDTFKPGAPRELFTSPLTRLILPRTLTRDGQRVLALQSGDVAATRDLMLVENWLDEVKAKMR